MERRSGLAYGLIAYFWWGMVPLYFERLREHVPALEILAHRILWSLVFLAGIITWLGRWGAVGRCLRSRAMGTLLITAPLIGANWFCYIYAAVTQQLKEASLGFYITPLVSVALGLVFFHEKLRRLQWVAFTFALVGVAIMTHAGEQVPWIALALAITFSFYGMYRKTLPADPMVGLFVETLVLGPVALGYLVVLHGHDTGVMGQMTWTLDVTIMLSGVVTAIPLMAFAKAAKLLPLSTLGFLQYISPTIQLSIAVLWLKQPFRGGDPLSFVFIWTGLALFTFDSYRAFLVNRDAKSAERSAKAPLDATSTFRSEGPASRLTK